MRRIINQGLFWERTQTGELSAIVIEDRHPSLTAANEPFCTFSQMISYRDPSGSEVARVHQYLRTDGTIGASGKPDPKRVFAKVTLYRLHKKPKDRNNSSPHNVPLSWDGSACNQLHCPFTVRPFAARLRPHRFKTSSSAASEVAPPAESGCTFHPDSMIADWQ
jgi:hypothetical protein